MKQESKFKKIFIKFLIAFLVVVLLGTGSFFGINGFVKARANKYIVSVESASQLNDVDCILVLGCAVYGESTLSPMLEDRVITGLQLFDNGASEKLLMSGDHGKENYDEVNAMKKYCISKGVDPDVIFLDHAGFSTYESMYRAKEIFGVKKMIIVTQEYHLYRAVYIARSLGIDAYGVASDNIPIDIATSKYNNMRESLARIKDFLTCIFKPKPTYLGEAIPINGSAKLSDDKEYV